MARLTWNDVGERYFEAGVDRGVLYVDDNPGVTWNGLKAVREAPSGGDAQAYYLDGYKYYNLAASEEYEATIEAFSAPYEFGVCDGTASVMNGLFATQQPRVEFGFSYRTLVGNDLASTDYGYKIHIVYNALAKPTSRANSSLGSSTDPMDLSWGVTSRPPRTTGLKPTAHFVIDSRLTPSVVITQIESLLYGTDVTQPELPPISELKALFTGFLPMKLFVAEPNVYNLYQVDPTNSQAVMGTVAFPLPNGAPLLWLDTTNPGYVVPRLVTGV